MLKVVAAAVGGTMTALWAAWLLTSPAIDRRHLSPAPLTRLVRWSRARWIRAWLGVVGWTHVFDRLFGVPRASVASTPSVICWRDGSATLRRYHGEPRHAEPRHAEPILLVHAFVSEPWILDLTPSRSLVRALLGAGFDVWLFDPGSPTRETAHHGLGELARALLAAEQEVLAHTGAERLHLVGYCTGGTLALARAGAFARTHIGSIVTIASPVDMAVPGGMRAVLGSRWLKPVLCLDETACVPGPVIRESFHALRPQALQGMRARRRLRHDAAFCETYGALGRWVWEHRPLAGGVYYDLVDLYRTNALIDGRWHLGKQRVDLTQIDVPVLAALAARDHIVPAGSSHALASIPGIDVDVLACPSGHVSMLCGSGGARVLYPGLIGWLTRRQSRPTARARRQAGTTARARGRR